MPSLKKSGLLLCSMLFLAACGQTNQESSSSNNAQSSQAPPAETAIQFSEADIAALTAEAAENVEDRLNVIQERGTIRFGFSGKLAPYNFKEPGSGEFTGMETEITQLIGEDLGVEVEFVEMAFPSLIPATNLPVDHQNSIDVALNIHTRTPERAMEHDFTLPYLTSKFAVWVKADSDLQTLADLNGLTAAQNPTGSTADAANAAGAVELLPVNTPADGIKMVEHGRADFHVADYNASLWIQKHNPNDKVRILDETIDQIAPVGMVISQGSPQLLTALNKSIEEHTKNGDFPNIYESYIGEDISVDPATFTAFKDQTGIDW